MPAPKVNNGKTTLVAYRLPNELLVEARKMREEIEAKTGYQISEAKQVSKALKLLLQQYSETK